MSENTVLSQLSEVASRIKGTREIMGWSTSRMAKKTEVTEEQYIAYESGAQDLPFTFIHKCALAFGIEITELLEKNGIRTIGALAQADPAYLMGRYGILEHTSLKKRYLSSRDGCNKGNH